MLFRSQPNVEISTMLTLETGRADILVTTEPPAGEVQLDGHMLGASPVRIPGVPMGRHVFSASHEGYVSGETTLIVTSGTRPVHLSLVPRP